MVDEGGARTYCGSWGSRRTLVALQPWATLQKEGGVSGVFLEWGGDGGHPRTGDTHRGAGQTPLAGETPQTGGAVLPGGAGGAGVSLGWGGEKKKRGGG